MYRSAGHRENDTPKKAMCMILGKVTHCWIKYTHIWPRFTLGNSLEAFDLSNTDVNNPRYFLRLHHAIERAFDLKRLVFVPGSLLNVNVLIVYNSSTVHIYCSYCNLRNF